MNDHRYYTRSKDDMGINQQQQNVNPGTLSTGRNFGLGGGIQSNNLFNLDTFQNQGINNFGLNMSSGVNTGFNYNTYSVSNNTSLRPSGYNEQATLWEIFLKEGSGSVTIENKMKTNIFEENLGLSNSSNNMGHLNTFINLLGEEVSIEEVRYLDKRLGHRPQVSVQNYLQPLSSPQGFNVSQTMNSGFPVSGSNNLTSGFGNRIPLNNMTTTTVTNPLTPQFQNRFASGGIGGSLSNPIGGLNNQNTVGNNVSLPFPQVGNGMIQTGMQQPNLSSNLQNNMNTGLNSLRPHFGIQNNTLQTGTLQNNFPMQATNNPLQTNNPLLNRSTNQFPQTTGTNNFNGDQIGILGGTPSFHNTGTNTGLMPNTNLLNGGIGNQLNTNLTNPLSTNRMGTGTLNTSLSTGPGLNTGFNTGINTGVSSGFNNNITGGFNSNIQTNNLLTNPFPTSQGGITNTGMGLTNPLQFGMNTNNLLTNNLQFQGQPNLLQTNTYNTIGHGMGSNLITGMNNLNVKPPDIKPGNILGFNPDTLKDPKTLTYLSYNTNINQQPQMSILDKTSIGPKTYNYITGNNNITFNSSTLQSTLQEKNINQMISQTSKDPYGITQRTEALIKTIEESKPRDYQLMRSEDKSYLNSLKPLSSSVSFSNNNGIIFKSSIKPLKESNVTLNKAYMKPTQLSIIKETNNSGKKSSYNEVNNVKWGSDTYKAKHKEELKGFESMLKLKPRKKTFIEPILETTTKKNNIEGILNLIVNIPDQNINFTLKLNKKQTGAALRKSIKEELRNLHNLEVETDDIVILSKEKPIGDKDILEEDLFIKDGVTVFLDRRPNDKKSEILQNDDFNFSIDYVYPTTGKFSTKPSMNEIMRMKPEELRQVEDFCVYNEHGEIKFIGYTDISGIDLDSIIILEPRCFSVYHGQEVPQLGQKLNKQAEVRLNNIIDEDVEYSEGEYLSRIQAFREKIEGTGNAKLIVFDWTENYIIIEVENFNRNN
jgi:nuclear pore complex protein Nup98-Nup96